MQVFFQTFVNGLVAGCIYALIALGYTMVYGILKLLNFAHGDVYMVGAYIGYFVLQLFGGAHGLSIPVVAAPGLDVCRAPRSAAGISAWRWSASPTGRCETRRESRR